MDKPVSLQLLTPPHSSFVIGLIIILMGSVLAISGVVDAIELSNTHLSEGPWLSAGFFWVLGLMIVLVGIVMMRAKGGAMIDRNAKVLRIFGDKPSEFVALPLSDIAYLRVRSRTLGTDTDAIPLHSAEAVTHNGSCLVLTESPERDDAAGFAQFAADALGSQTVWPEPEPREPAPVPRTLTIQPVTDGITVTFRLGFRWSLAGVLFSAGVANIFLGTVMLIHVHSSPLLGFLAGPPLLVFGLLMFTLALGKSLGTETLRIDAHGVHRSIRFFGQNFGEWSFSNPDSTQPYARLRPMGAKGHAIEFVNSQKAHYAAVGTSQHTQQLNSQTILPFVGMLNAQIRLRLPVIPTPDPAPQL